MAYWPDFLCPGMGGVPDIGTFVFFYIVLHLAGITETFRSHLNT
jgi:hypothetical protein